MNKSDLTNHVAEKSGLTKSQAASAVDALFDTITKALVAGDKLTITGLLSFETKQQESRTARNPATGAEINIPAKKVVKIRVGKSLKDAVAAA